MNTANKFLALSASILLASGLAACDRNSAETAGKSIDQAVNKTGDKISDTSKALGKQGDKAAKAIDDTAITAKVKTAILAEPGLKTLQIHVDTTNGVTTLSGSVDSQQDIDKAKTVAAAVSGVKQVDNQLLVKPAK